MLHYGVCREGVLWRSFTDVEVRHEKSLQLRKCTVMFRLSPTVFILGTQQGERATNGVQRNDAALYIIVAACARRFAAARIAASLEEGVVFVTAGFGGGDVKAG